MEILKRRVPRKKINRPVGLLFQGQYEIGRVVQVGEGGVMILSPLALHEGHRVLLTFSLSGDGFISTKATIRYQAGQDGGMKSFGVEFDELAFQARRSIRAFVATHSSSKVKGMRQID